MSTKTIQQSGPDWFAVHSKANAERLVADGLTRKGYRAYVPVTTVRITHARRSHIVARPLFRRYLFVNCHDTQLSEVRKTWGVEWLVENVGRAAVMRPHGIVEALQAAEAEGAFDTTRPKDNERPFKPGDKALVATGPFADLVAEIISTPTDSRVEILFKLMGQRMKITMPVANLRPTG